MLPNYRYNSADIAHLLSHRMKVIHAANPIQSLPHANVDATRKGSVFGDVMRAIKGVSDILCVRKAFQQRVN